MNNTLPIYITGVFTGIVFEVGYLNTQITPIYDGYATMNKVTYSPAGGFMINKKMKELLLAENPLIEPDVLSFPLLEDIKFKFTKVLHK